MTKTKIFLISLFLITNINNANAALHCPNSPYDQRDSGSYYTLEKSCNLSNAANGTHFNCNFDKNNWWDSHLPASCPPSSMTGMTPLQYDNAVKAAQTRTYQH